MALMTHRPYSYKGMDLRFSLSNNSEKHLVVKDVIKALGLRKRPEDVAKNLSSGSCYKSRIEFPGMHSQIMWVIKPAGLQELLEKLDAYKIRSFVTWLKERHLLPHLLLVESYVNTTDEVADEKTVTVDTIPGVIDEATEDYKKRYEKIIEWIKQCPVYMNILKWDKECNK